MLHRNLKFLNLKLLKSSVLLSKSYSEMKIKSFSTGCPTTYQTLQFFINFTTNEDVATKFQADLPHCVRNVMAA